MAGEVCGGTKTWQKHEFVLWRLFSPSHFVFFFFSFSLPSFACRCLSTSLEMLGQAAARYVNVAIDPSLLEPGAERGCPHHQKAASFKKAVGGVVLR